MPQMGSRACCYSAWGAGGGRKVIRKLVTGSALPGLPAGGCEHNAGWSPGWEQTRPSVNGSFDLALKLVTSLLPASFLVYKVLLMRMEGSAWSRPSVRNGGDDSTTTVIVLTPSILCSLHPNPRAGQLLGRGSSRPRLPLTQHWR